MRKGVYLALSGGACFASVATGQTGGSNSTALPRTVQAITLTDIRGGDYAREYYGDRGDSIVYDTGLPPFATSFDSYLNTGGEFAGPFNTLAVLDDIAFGAWGSSGSLTLNGLAWGVWVPANGTLDQLYMRVTFHNVYDTTLKTLSTGVSDPTIGSSGDLVWNLDIGTGWSDTSGSATGKYFANPQIFDTSITLSDSFIGLDRTVGVRMELFSNSGFTTRAANYALMRRGAYSANRIGSTNVQSYYAGTLGNPAINTVTGGTLSAGQRRGTYLVVNADFPQNLRPAAPTNRTIIGELPDGVSTISSTIAAGGLKWYTVNLASDASDDLNQFLDIDTEGSAVDVSVAIYDSTGTLIAVDHDSGSGSQSQLSFGIGRRPSVGDGRQYDGRNYQMEVKGLRQGEYDVVVAASATGGAPSATSKPIFLNHWYVAPNPANVTTGGSFSLRFNTNVNGAPAAPAVPPSPVVDLTPGTPPDPNAVDLLSPGVYIEPAPLSRREVRWYKFDTCRATSPGITPIFFDMGGSDAIGTTQAIFDSAGDLIAMSTDPEFNAPELMLDGLPPGEYYLAHAYSGQDIGLGVLNPSTGLPINDGVPDRWQFRSLSDNYDGNIQVGGNITVFWDVPCGSGIGSCPWTLNACFADYDVSGGIDGDDVIVFFMDWDSGQSCADVDGSGGVDGDDVISFFSAWDASGVGYPGC